MLGCCQSYGRGGMEGTEALKIQAINDKSTTDTEILTRKGVVVVGKTTTTTATTETLDNKELERINEKKKEEMKTKKGVGETITGEDDGKDDNPDDDVEKNDSTKDDDGCSGSEKLEAPISQQDLSMKSEELSVDDDVGSCSEENSVDNNTFNIIHTENSESQEVSELTNDESSSPAKENGEGEADDGAEGTRENDASERGTDGDDSDDELSCLEEEEEEEDDDEESDEESESGDSDDDQSSVSDGGDESDDEREYDNDSLEGEDEVERKKSEIPIPIGRKISQTTVVERKRSENIPVDSKKSDSVAAAATAEKTVGVVVAAAAAAVVVAVPTPVESNKVPKDLPLPPAPAASTTKGARTNTNKPNSPQIPIRQRLRSFGKKDPGDFTIEIFESKRKPQQDIASDLNNRQGVSGDVNTKPNMSKSMGEVSELSAALASKNIVKTSSSCSDLRTPDSASSDKSQQAARKGGGGESDKSKCPATLADSDPKESLTDKGGPPPTGDLNNGLVAATTTPSPSTQTSASTPPRGGEDGGAEDGSSSSNKDHEASGAGELVESKKPTPMAFTIDLDGGSGAGEASNSSKKLDITASISKWAPKHRRNLSLTKVDEHKVVENFFDENGNSRAKRRSTISCRLDKVEERVGKPPMGRPRSGTIGATGLPQGVRRGGGYHSEGYFSSDQDDEAPRRTDLKSPRSPRTPELRSPQTPQRLVRSSSQDSAKGNSLRKQAGKSEGRSCCKGEKKPTLAEATGRAKSDKGSVKNGCKMTVEGGNKSSSGTSLNSGHTFNHKQEPGSDHAKEEKDDVSEAGTYTIEKDSSSPEVEQARNDIDRVFGVCAVENGGEVGTEVTPRGNASPRTSPDDLKFKSPGSLSRNSPNWIQQWAAQVAEHTKPAADPLRSPRGPSKLPPQPPQDGSMDSRPRRKLPTPPTAPHHHSPSPFTPVSPKQSDLSDHESPTKNRAYDTHDTDALLRHTEQLVTSLQARVNKGAANHQGIRGSSFESHDSGGDSDLDTSTSYPIHDEDERLMKIGSQLKAKLKLVGIDGDSDMETSTSYPTQDEDDRMAKIGPHLKAKLKLAGIDGTCNSPPLTKSPRKPPDALGLESRIKLGHLKRERSIMSDGGYDVYSTGREEASMQSDSSSDASEPPKDSRKPSDNNPPLKFNRAFSLRRARLGCDDSSSSTTATHAKPPSPIDKKKVVRPSSAGNAPGSRKLPLSHSRSQSSVPRPTPPATRTATTSGTDFSRGDGGRFSLRIPRSGSGNVNQQTTNKSPSRATTKKEGPPRRAHAPRSNSTLSSKEVDFQNWKRRKNYDPMKAAAEGRKKVNDKKTDKINTSGAHSTSERSPSPPASLLRSASFHGTEGMGTAGRWPRRPTHLYPGEEDGPYSLEEEQGHPVPHCSPLRRSPTSPNQLASPHTTSPARQSLLSSARARRSSYALSDEGEAMLGSPTRKTSLDESGSEGKRSPSGGSTRGSGAMTSTRSRAKMEALDNLVISTIHSLSVKVRTTSETLLQKLKSQYDEEGDRAALLEEVLAHLSESSDQSLTPGHTRSTSRELAGILRNLKKIEHALEVIDRVMVCGEEEEEDDLEDDLEGGGGQEWGESDY